MRETEYLKLKQRIEADYRKKLDALELVWKMSGGSSGNGPVPSTSSLVGRTKGRLAQSIRAFLQTTTGEFKISDIQHALVRTAPELGEVRRQSIATALRRQKGIETIAAGRGRREGRFRKVEQARREGA